MENVPGIPVRPSLINSQTPIMKRVVTKIPTTKIDTEFVSLKLAATFLSFLFSIYLFFFMDSQDSKLYGIFVGLWVPSILSAFMVLKTSFRKESL